MICLFAQFLLMMLFLLLLLLLLLVFFNYNLIWTLKRFVHFKGGKVFTKQCFWLQDMDKIFPDLSCAEGAHRGIGDSLLNSKILTEDSYQDCTPKETSCFISRKCGVVENDRISIITKLGELLNLKLNCKEDVIVPLSPSTLELSHVEDNKDVVDGAVVEMEEPLLTSGVDGLSKPSYPVLGEGLNLSNYIELLILCNVQTK